MNEYDDIIQSYTELAPAKATTALDADPDKAARALQLSRATGVAPLVINADQDRFEEDHRADMTAGIIRRNSQIAAYIRGNDLADHVSNDDYGNLDNASRAFSDTLDSHPIWGLGIPKRYIAEPLMEGLKGAIYGAGEHFVQEPFKIPENYNAWSKGAYEFLGIPLRILNAVAGGFMGGAGGLARQATIAAGGDENQANRAEREARGIVESEMGRGGSGLQHADHAIGQVVRQQEAMALAKPWLDAGVDVPRGVHPLIDQIKEKTNTEWVDKIQNALQEAQNSATRERDPELFKNFAQQHFADAQMGISADAVVRLYGDKLPSREDGILGWVPGIEEKLEAAKTFGEDVHVPLADWVTYVDPQLASELKPDLRAWPGGITKNEAAIKDIAASAIDGALPQVRTSAALEPMFAIGDRPLKLEKGESIWKGMEDYNFVDHNGKVVGEITIFPDPMKKQLYIASVSSHDLQPNTMGPSLIRDIKRQLKELYPEYETISGYRISGAREEAGAPKEQRKPVVKLALGDNFNLERNLEKETELKKLYRNYIDHEFNIKDDSGNILGTISITPNEAEKQLFVRWIGRIGSDVDTSIGPNSFGFSAIKQLKNRLKEIYPKYETITGHRETGAREKAGTTGSEYESSSPVVKLALSDAFELSQEYTDLRRILETAPTKFGDVTADLVPKELWTTHERAIGQAVQEEINRITGKTAEPVLASDLRYEGIDGIRGVYHQAPGEIAKILVNMHDFDATGIARHEAIHHLYREGFFKPEEWNSLIEASKAEGWIDRYQIADRYGEHLNELGLHEEAIAEAFRDWAKTRDQQPVTPVTTIFQKLWDLMQRIKDRVAEILGREPRFDELFEAAYSGELAQRESGAKTSGDMFAKAELETQLKAEAAGLDAKSFKRIQDLIQKRYQEDIAAAMKRAEAEQKTLQSKEWKEAAKEIRKEVEADIKQRPDVAADLLIGSGELGGKQLERKNYPLRAEDLSEAQKASLPRRYYSKDGVPVDMMANLFGFTSGDRLIEELSSYTKSREGMSAQEGLRKTIDEEVQRRMEEKFGKLQDNIMLEAMDQALSETNLQILAEEWQGAAMAAGVKVVDKDLAKGEALAMFGKMKLSDINAERLLGIMGKIGRDTERLLIAGKNADALVLMQRKYMTGLIAAEARKLQKEQAAAEKTFKTLSKREVTSMEPEYTDYAHQIMMQIGKPVRRSIQDLQEALARHDGKGNLKDFIEMKQQDFRAIDAWDQLFDSSWRKEYDQLTADEFRAIHATIKTLVHNGREERKIYKAGEAADWADLKSEFINSIQNAAHGKLATVGKGKKRLLPDQYFTGVVQMETFLNRLDGYNPRNNWFQYVFRDLADGTVQFDKWKKDYAKKISALPSPDNLSRTIDNPLFKNQKNDALLPFTRRDLIGVMLNTGNDTNLVKMAHGYKLKSDDVMAWVHQHATKQDWDFVQGIWDTFKEIKRDTDTMYRSLSGVAPENIPIRPIDTPHGKYAGGYYPLIRHPEFGDVAGRRFKDVLAQENWVNTLPAAGHTKLRTGAIYPLATDLDFMIGHMNQMLFDNAMRPAIIQASKVFHDTSIKNAIYKYFGQAWEGELHDYIVGVANSQNYMAKNMQGFAWLSETLRQNMIGNVVGLNPSTPMKHGPTALVLSMKEVGAMEFAKAVRMLHTVNETTGAKWMKFVDENSLEIQRRDRNWQETLFGGVASHDPTNATEYYRQKMIQFAAKPVAWSDMASARPTWLAAYLKAMEEGSDHGEAVALGDRAVRRAHGSTATTSRTAVQRNWNPWFVSIYNFWSDILNRQIETVWKAGDIYKLTEGNPVQKGLATAPTILGGAFAYVLWPMIVENVVSPHPHKDDESWASKAGKSLMFTLSGGWPILRDIGSAMAMGRDPQMGFTGTALSTGYNVLRDLAKNEPFNKEHAGKLIQDWMSVVGGLTGGPGVQLGRVMRFGHDVYTGKENPKNAWQWMVGLRYGTTNRHSQSWDDYWKGKH